MAQLHLTDYITTTALREMITRALVEDIGAGDITTEGVLGERGKLISHAKLISKATGILCGAEVFAQTFRLQDQTANTQVTFSKTDGATLAPTETVATLTAPLSVLLSAERTALNFLAHLSGVATLTHKFMDKVSDTQCKILDTRKTTPLWRGLEKYAVACGGGLNHRRGLYDMALIKENHITAAGSLSAAVGHVREHIRKLGKQIEIEVEVRNGAELREALSAGVTRVLLDNQSPDSLRELMQIIRKHPARVSAEASGNVTLENVAEYARTGVDFISVGALTHSAPAFDFSLLIE